MGMYSQGASELIGLIGAGLQANSNSHKISDVKALASDWQPSYEKYTDEYFNNLDKYAPQAEKLSSDIGKADLTSALALREQALPGIGAATKSAAEALFPLLRGELPDSVLRAFNTSGAASSVGGGFGGSGFGFLNQGLFGARGALGAMQTGYSLLGSLLNTMPRVNSPSASSFLNQIITPQQRVGDQLAFRQQQIGIGLAAAGMPSGNDAWANYIEGVAGVNAGGGGGGGFSGVGAGAGGGFGGSMGGAMGGGAAAGGGAFGGGAAGAQGGSFASLWGGQG